MEQSPLCYAALEYIHSLSGACEKKRGRRCENERGGEIERQDLGREQLFWRELFGMLIFPPVPKSHGDLLENASHRYSEEPPKQSEEFCASEERENGHNGMNSN